MIYKPVDKYFKKKNIESKIFFLHLILIWCRQDYGGADRYDVEDDAVEWDIIYNWLEEAVPV